MLSMRFLWEMDQADVATDVAIGSVPYVVSNKNRGVQLHFWPNGSCTKDEENLSDVPCATDDLTLFLPPPWCLGCATEDATNGANGIATRNKKLLGTSASLLATSALLVVTRTLLGSFARTIHLFV